MAHHTITRFRDHRTGYFVSKATWTRSKAHGGTAIKREYHKVTERKEEEEEEELQEPDYSGDDEDFNDEDYEYEGAFDSPGKGKK